ncbi:MAG: DUF4105 domain-containing protein [Muribaculaceae bacterium]|nr:DUF4105 domain-containing protein [Muribaculaceae bacterium]
MRRIIYALVIVVFTFGSVAEARASLFNTGLTETDTISVSLLTASQGKQIYEKFGHTGIRIHIPSKRFNGVYHYGLFSFDEPYFEYRFVKGETDYMIGLMHYHDFLTMYAIRGSSVRELPLCLTQEEARNLYRALQINMLPENETYRYSFLYDNCATRPLEIINRSLTGEVRLDATDMELPTYRTLIHKSTQQDKWVTFGLDLILDGETDENISLPDKPFLPEITEQIFQNYEIERNGVTEKLAGTPKEVLRAREEEAEPGLFSFITPMVFAISLLVVVALISIKEIITLRHNKVLDTIIFFVCGVLGIVIYFLLLFSEHPAVSANINAMWLHPIWLVMIPLIWIRKAQKFLYCYHFINFALLLLFFLVIMFIKQEVGTVAVVLVATLLLRTITYLAVERRRKEKQIDE